MGRHSSLSCLTFICADQGQMHWQGFPCLTVGRFGFGREVWTTDMPGLMSNSLIGRGGECIRLGGKVAEVFHDVLLWGDGWRLGTKGEKAREKERVLYFGGKMHSSRKRNKISGCLVCILTRLLQGFWSDYAWAGGMIRWLPFNLLSGRDG